MKRRLILSALLAAAPLLAQTSSSLDGIWLGTLHAGETSLRIQFHFAQGSTGKWTCSVDSLDQGGMGIPCAVTSAVNPITIDVAAVKGSFHGALTADALDGTWHQGDDIPLSLTRQTSALASSVPLPPPPDPAMPPVTADNLKSVLDRDLAAALDHGALAPSTHAGITIGILQHGVRRIFTYGSAKPDSVFEIGSISKTFTGLILAQMVQQNKVRLDTPVRDLLPPGTVAKPAGPEITLLDLSDQHSGLPRMPGNFSPSNSDNPYADYNAKLLYAEIAKHGVALPPNTNFGYSNLGVGLLGQALADRAGISYPELLRQQITSPLHMTETVIALTPALQARFIQGYDGKLQPAHAWDLDSLAGAGAIRSTAADMLIYLDAQLHPNHLAASTLAAPNGKTLAAAIEQTHVLHAVVAPGTHIALNWFHIDDSGTYWHNGGTGGYTSYAAFNPQQDFAFIILTNVGPGENSLADILGSHIEQRLEGKPAASLPPRK